MSRISFRLTNWRITGGNWRKQSLEARYLPPVLQFLQSSLGLGTGVEENTSWKKWANPAPSWAFLKRFDILLIAPVVATAARVGIGRRHQIPLVPSPHNRPHA
jgi:hypothetical protein